MIVLNDHKIKRIEASDTIRRNSYDSACSAKLSIGIKIGEKVAIEWRIQIHCDFLKTHVNDYNGYWYFIGVVTNKCNQFDTACGELVNSYGISGRDNFVFDGSQTQAYEYKRYEKYSKSFTSDDIIHVLFDDENKLTFTNETTGFKYQMQLPKDDKIIWYPAVSLLTKDGTYQLLPS